MCNHTQPNPGAKVREGNFIFGVVYWLTVIKSDSVNVTKFLFRLSLQSPNTFASRRQGKFVSPFFVAVVFSTVRLLNHSWVIVEWSHLFNLRASEKAFPHLSPTYPSWLQDLPAEDWRFSCRICYVAQLVWLWKHRRLCEWNAVCKDSRFEAYYWH